MSSFECKESELVAVPGLQRHTMDMMGPQKIGIRADESS